MLSAVVILFFFTIYTAAGLAAGAILFEKTFALDYRTALWAGIAVIVSYIASDPESRVLTLVAYAWAGFGAGFGPAVILSLLWPRTTRNGTLAGMATGAVTVVAWANLAGGMFDVYEILPRFLAGFAAMAVVSLLGREPPPKVRETFSRV